MYYQKPFKTHQEQLTLLVSRGLIVNDSSFAENILTRINYYRFSAYALPFQQEKDIFNKNTAFEEILNLYNFDRELRILLFEYIESLEIALRTIICYFISEKYGPFGYTDLNNFSPSFLHSNWIDAISKELSRSKETFIEHYKTKYHMSKHLPLWMAVEVFSFGSLSFLVHGLRMQDQKKISKQFNVPAPVLTSWLHCLTYIRNIIAHHARLWNRELAIRPKFPHKDEK